MMKTRTLALAAVLAALGLPAHADVASDARAFGSQVKTAGKEGAHAVRDAAHAVGRGAKTAGHAVADAAVHGYRATKALVTRHE